MARNKQGRGFKTPPAPPKKMRRYLDPVTELMGRAGAGKGIVLPPDSVAMIAGHLVGQNLRIQTLNELITEYEAAEELRLLEVDDDSEE